MNVPSDSPGAPRAGARWSLLFGNFVIGCGVMAVQGTLNDIARSLAVSIALAGRLIAAAAGVMAAAQTRARDITFIFLGWSLASVAGVPLTAWIGETFGWRTAFGSIAACATAATAWVYVALPDGVRPAAMPLSAWEQVLGSPVLMTIVAGTALHAAGQFTLFSYIAPYYKLVLSATTAQISLLFMVFGAVGLVGSVVLTRVIAQVGVSQCVMIALSLMALTLVAWPLAGSVAMMLVVIVPWGLGCFSSNSAQQARLNEAGPGFAPALMALNSSAMYLGQAAGAAGGGWLFAQHGFAPLHWVAAAWVLAAMALSLGAGRMSARVAA